MEAEKAFEEPYDGVRRAVRRLLYSYHSGLVHHLMVEMGDVEFSQTAGRLRVIPAIQVLLDQQYDLERDSRVVCDIGVNP